eukprot:7451387-Heterocapsa_arctica.AAC.1
MQHEHLANCALGCACMCKLKDQLCYLYLHGKCFAPPSVDKNKTSARCLKSSTACGVNIISPYSD